MSFVMIAETFGLTSNATDPHPQVFLSKPLWVDYVHAAACLSGSDNWTAAPIHPNPEPAAWGFAESLTVRCSSDRVFVSGPISRTLCGYNDPLLANINRSLGALFLWLSETFGKYPYHGRAQLVAITTGFPTSHVCFRGFLSREATAWLANQRHNHKLHSRVATALGTLVSRLPNPARSYHGFRFGDANSGILAELVAPNGEAKLKIRADDGEMVPENVHTSAYHYALLTGPCALLDYAGSKEGCR